jgi:hypothetical protein
MKLNLFFAVAVAAGALASGARADGGPTDTCRAAKPCMVQCASELWSVPIGATMHYEDVDTTGAGHMRMVLSKATLIQSTNYFSELSLPKDSQVEIFLKPDQQCATYGFN